MDDDETYFQTTHWSVVLAATDPDDSGFREALDALCRRYWYPVYVFVRRRGYSVDEAGLVQTQETFVQGRDVAQIASGDGHPIGHLPPQVVGDFEGHRLLPFDAQAVL